MCARWEIHWRTIFKQIKRSIDSKRFKKKRKKKKKKKKKRENDKTNEQKKKKKIKIRINKGRNLYLLSFIVDAKFSL